MAFGGQMANPGDRKFFEKAVDSLLIADISLHKGVIRRLVEVGEVFQVARIGKGIEVDYLIIRIFVYKQPDDMGPDKTGAPGD